MVLIDDSVLHGIDRTEFHLKTQVVGEEGYLTFENWSQFLRAIDAEGITIVSDQSRGDGDMQVATIINEPSDDTPGYGVQNTFEWSEENGDWELVSVTPTDAQQVAPEE